MKTESELFNQYKTMADGKEVLTYGNAIKAIQEYHNQFIPTDDQLQAMALEKFPVGELRTLDNLYHQENRNRCEQALRDLVKMMGGEK